MHRASWKHRYYKNPSPKDSHAENKDYTLKQDYVNDGPLSCDGSLPSPTSSNTHTSPKAAMSFKSSTDPSFNANSNAFHAVPYSYPQGPPLKDTQANLHLAENNFNNAKPKEPKSLCTTMPTSASPSLSSKVLHTIPTCFLVLRSGSMSRGL